MFWRSAQSAPQFRFSDSRVDRYCQCLSNLILNNEHILKSTVIPFRPDVIAGFRINKLYIHPNASASATYATLHDIAYTKFGCDLPHIGGPAPICEAGTSCDNGQRSAAR